MAIRFNLNQEEVSRFWNKVLISENECWEWLAAKNEKGYGVFGIRKYTDKAPRISWRLKYGSIKNNLFVLHKCDNPGCVRPDHLFLGTNKQNIEDMILKKRNSKPPEMGGWNKKKFPEEIINLLGKLPDYKIAEKTKTNKTTIARLRKKLKINSYATQTGNKGQFDGKGLHPRWKT